MNNTVNKILDFIIYQIILSILILLPPIAFVYIMIDLMRKGII